MSSSRGGKGKTQSAKETIIGSMTWDKWMQDVPQDLRPPDIKDVGAVKTWSDPTFRKQKPWTAILNYIGSVMISIGEPFISLSARPSKTVAAFAVWQHQEPYRYPIRRLSTKEKIANATNRSALLSQPAFKKLPEAALHWIRDVQDKSGHVAWLLADVEGCMAYLRKEMQARQALKKTLNNLRKPSPSEEVRRMVGQDSHQAMIQLNEAMRKAQAAQRMVAPVARFFCSKHSPYFKKDRNRLVELLVAYGGVSPRHASGLVEGLLPTLNPSFARKRDSIRVSAST